MPKYEGQGDPLTSQIIGAAIEVHKTLGHGFLETVYQRALARELTARSIPFREQSAIPVFYKGEKLDCGYRADFICFGEILVEIKAFSALSPADITQTINYLKASNIEKGLVLNFGGMVLQVKRLAFSPNLPLPDRESF